MKWEGFDKTLYVVNEVSNDLSLISRRSTEEVFQALEDNQVKLSTMKASRFVKAFEADVDHWERTLSLILEVVEMLLTVQRQWMYLEVGWNGCFIQDSGIGVVKRRKHHAPLYGL